MHPLYLTLFCLLAGIGVIIFLSVKCRVHPFFALLVASFIVGLGVGFPVPEVINTMKEGFGNILKSLGFIVVLGATIGILLERNGSTTVMADFILKIIGPKYPALAMSLTGFVVGLPIFCDSGFIVLNGLNQPLAKRTGTNVVSLALSMAVGLYAVHCLIPPHPGATAAAALLGVDYGKLILLGILAALPAMLAGYWYVRYAGHKMPVARETEAPPVSSNPVSLPTVTQAFLPVLIPILLIATKSFLVTNAPDQPFFLRLLSAAGDPVMALSIGVVLVMSSIRPWNTAFITHGLQEAAEKAGGILVIIGAGGAFGAVLAMTRIGQQFSEALPLAQLGLAFPFLVTSILKTAQGSSTVAIVTAASIVQPLLPALGLESPDSTLFCVLAMGAGSMMVSHANDAYFWVIARFGQIDMQTMLRVYSVATVLMGLTTFLTVCILAHLF